MDRRSFLMGAAGLGGAVLLGGCGSSNSGGSPAASSVKRPSIAKEPGNLSILEWDGYQAFGTPTNKKAGGLSAGEEHTQKVGAHGIPHSLIVHHSEALNKVRPGQQFDVIPPCIENLQTTSATGSCSR